MSEHVNSDFVARMSETLKKFKMTLGSYDYKKASKGYEYKLNQVTGELERIDTGGEGDEVILQGKFSMTGFHFSKVKDFMPVCLRDEVESGYSEHSRIASLWPGLKVMPAEWVKARLSRTHPALVRDDWLWLEAVTRIEDVLDNRVIVMRSPNIDCLVKCDLLFLLKDGDEYYVYGAENVSDTPGGWDSIDNKHKNRLGVADDVPGFFRMTVSSSRAARDAAGEYWGLSQCSLDGMSVCHSWYPDKVKTVPLSMFSASHFDPARPQLNPGHELMTYIDEGLEMWWDVTGNTNPRPSIQEYLASV